MLILYRFGIWFYWLIARLLAPFSSKALKFVDGRKNWKVNLSRLFSENQANVVWLHAASLGEFEQGRPVMEALKKSHPQHKILLTFFSPSGYEIRKNFPLADWVMYLPLDTPKNAAYFLDVVKPRMALFVKYEFWYFYLKALQQRAIPTLMVSCILRPNQLYFRWYGRFFRPVLSGLTHYFMQDQASLELGKTIGIEQATLAGDTRFDRVLTIAADAKEVNIMRRFKGEDKLLVIGSSWPSDMKHLLPFIAAHGEHMKFAIAPHNIGEEEIRKLTEELPTAIRYSAAADINLTDQRMLIIDNMGMLSSLYRYGDFAFIGGGFRGALHNTLEAAVYGIPVCFGEHPKNSKFKEAIGLVEAGGAFTFSTYEELEAKFAPLFSNAETHKAYAQAAGSFVKSRAGATPLVMQKIEELL